MLWAIFCEREKHKDYLHEGVILEMTVVWKGEQCLLLLSVLLRKCAHALERASVGIRARSCVRPHGLCMHIEYACVYSEQIY